MKKGFTVPELLTVIGILALLLTIAVPSIISIQNKIQSNMYCKKIDSIEAAAVLYGQSIVNDLSDASSPHMVSVLQLVEKNYLTKDKTDAPYILDPRNKSDESALDLEVVEVLLKNSRVVAIYKNVDDVCKK